ncbi:MAG: MarR family transcriptional regulator [Chloroflexi bacterium]|nr:MAG: MarR family transcriptional regulator [Chloroflexota bacterium]
MEPHCETDHEAMRARVNQQIKKLFDVEDTRGIELLLTLQHTAHLSEFIENQFSGEMELSGPRMRLMIRLLVEEQMGNREGISPTELSRFHRVSKNTISALLRGLEEQGLIRRSLDSEDLRVFRIQLTDAGREMVFKTAPVRIAGMNKILSGMEPDEIAKLTALLDKLQLALILHLRNTGKFGELFPPPGGAGKAALEQTREGGE